MAAKTRSRNGCFTCRRRKKKCDESLTPDCKNCLANRLQCTWPEHVRDLHRPATPEEHLSGDVEDVETQFVESRSQNLDSSNYPTVIDTDDSMYAAPVDRYSSNSRVSKPDRKIRNYFLQRIAMQQDCVDDKNEGASGDAKLEISTSTDIKARIARQLDIGDLGI